MSSATEVMPVTGGTDTAAVGCPASSCSSELTTAAAAEFKPPPLAPIFEPTLEEFEDFYGYLEAIAPIVSRTGICKIRPPKDWNPPFAIDVAAFRFRPRVQRLNELEAVSRVKLNFLDQLAKFWDLQGVRLRVPNVDRRQLDLHRLYTTVKQLGGYHEVTNSKQWPKVASVLGYRQAGKSLSSHLKHHYQKILLPFDLIKSGNPAKTVQASKTIERQVSAPVSDTKGSDVGRYSRSSAGSGGGGSGRVLRQAAAAADDARRLQLWSSPTKRPADVSVQTTKATKRSNSGGAPKWLDNLLCRECGRGDQESVLLICEGCGAPHHTFCLYPPLTEVPPGDWRCPSCVSETIASAPRPAEYGFEQSRTEYSLAEFGAMADQFKSNYFNSSSPVPLDQVETEFWRLLQALSEPVSVEYGADIHSSVCGSGFPTRSATANNNNNNNNSNSKQAEWRAHAEHTWNLNNLPLGSSGLLRFLRQDINGMVIPWCYVGMLFSAFCWHIEDHWSYSINYLHWGDPKTWYGVPGESAPALEAAMREEAGELFERSPDLLHHITTIMNPAKLVAKGVPVYRLDQEAGDFVITFPRAYHAGFNQGFNFAEAVNFCSPSWLPMGRECVEQYTLVQRPCVFSHEELVCNMAAEIDSLTADQAEYLLDELKVLQQRLSDLTQTAASLGITDSQREQFEGLPDDDRQCAICNTTVYVYAVLCSCQKRRLVCGRHPDQLLCSSKDSCRQKPGAHRLVYRHSQSELLALTVAVADRCEQLAEWRRQADMIMAAAPSSATAGSAVVVDLPDRSTLEALERRSVELRVSQSCSRLRRLRGALRMAERAAGVLRLLLRQPEPGANRISESAFRALAVKLRELPCRLPECDQFQLLRDRVDAWRSRARQLLATSASSTLAATSVAELLAEAEASLPVAMDDAAALKSLGRRMAWKAEARVALDVGDNPPPSLADLQRLIDTADDVTVDADKNKVDDVELVDLSARLSTLHRQASRLAMSVRECLQPDRLPLPDAAELAGLVEAGQKLRVRLEPLQRLADLLTEAARWEVRAAGAVDAEFKDAGRRSSLEELEQLAAEGRSLGVRLERMQQLEALIGQANAWLDRASRNFLKKQSPHSLLQVLLPRSADSFLPGLFADQHPPPQQHKKSSASASAEDPSRRFSSEQTDASRVAAYRDLASRELQAALAARRRNDSAGGCFCGRQLPASVCFLQCELCRLWMHAGCAPLPKYLKPLGTGGPALRAALREVKYLCPACERGRRPRVENLLSLLLVLQPLPVQITAGAALQCLTERAMAWQSRVHTALLGSTELRIALIAVVKAMRLQLPDRLNRQLGDDQASSFSSATAANPDDNADAVAGGAPATDKKPRRKSPLFPRGASFAPGGVGGLGSGGGGGPSMADCLRRPRLSLPSAARAKLEAMMLEGDLLEVAMEETTWLWHLLQASAEDVENGNVEVEDDVEDDEEESEENSSTMRSDADEVENDVAAAPPSAPTVGAVLAPTSASKKRKSRVQRRDSMSLDLPEKRPRRSRGPSAAAAAAAAISGLFKNKRKSVQQAAEAAKNGNVEVEGDEEEKCSAADKCVQPTGVQVNWVQCDRCSNWYHWLCVNVRSNAELVGSYYCPLCLQRPKATAPSLGKGRRKLSSTTGKTGN